MLDSQITPLTARVTTSALSFQARGSAGVETLSVPVRYVGPLWAIYRLPDEFLPFLSLCSELGSSTFFFFFGTPKIFQTSPFLPFQFSLFAHHPVLPKLVAVKAVQ